MIGQRILSKAVAQHVRYIRPVLDPPAGSLTAAVYDQVQRDMRLVTPPILLHSPVPETLAAFWALMRETLTASGTADRRTKEVVAAAVSVANICPYCVDMHSAGMYDVGTVGDAEAVAADRTDEVQDPQVRSLALWARHGHRTDAAGQRPPFPPEHAAELIGVAVTFHYLNRMVNLFLPNYLFSPRLQGGARRRVKQGLSVALRPIMRNPPRPGGSLALLPAAPVPADALWATGNPVVAEAVARAAAVFDAAGARYVSEPVRALLYRYLGRWRGEEAPISRSWCEEAIEELPVPDRPAGRLALLTAFASYQLDEHVVTAFKQVQPDDAALVGAAAWVSYTTAREIGTRMAAQLSPAAPEPGRR